MSRALGRVRQQDLPIVTKQLGQQPAQWLHREVLQELQGTWIPPINTSLAGQ